MEALLSIKSSLLEVMGTNSVGLHGVECGEVETPNGSEGSLIHVEQRWAHTHMTLNADGDGETPESAAELRLQNSSLRAELKSTRSKLEHVQRQHELVRGQQRNQQRAASALQDRLQELEQGAALPPLSCEEEEKVQALEGALEEERGVTAVLLGRLIDNDAKIQEQQRQMEELQEQLAAQRAEAAAHEHKLKACLDDSLAVLQKENAAVARLETRLLSAEQALKREGGASSDGAPLRKADAEGELSEAGRAYLLDMQAQLIGLELQLGEERKKCAFMQRKAQETERELIQAGAEVQALQIALSAAGILVFEPTPDVTPPDAEALAVNLLFNNPSLTTIEPIPILEGHELVASASPAWNPDQQGLPRDLTAELAAAANLQASASAVTLDFQNGVTDGESADPAEDLLPSAAEAASAVAIEEEEAVPESEAEVLQEEDSVAASGVACVDPPVVAAQAVTPSSAPLPPALAEAEADALAAAKRESRTNVLGAAAMVGVAGLVATTLAVDLTDAALVGALITAGATLSGDKEKRAGAAKAAVNALNVGLNITETVARKFGLKSHVEMREEAEARARVQSADSTPKPATDKE
eukprot:jgi/Botrbrau1/10812/Bobra.0064s0018.1